MKIGAGKFKAKCLELMDQVRDARVEYIITKHGKPVAKLVPLQESEAPSLYGCMKGSVLRQDDLISPLKEDWEADASS